MSSITKRFSVGWVAGLALGVTCSTFAGSVGGTFNTGDTLTAAQMTGIQSAVNDNNGRIAALETGAPPCPTAMTRVGSTCVDNARVANNGVSWSDAVTACRNAGKRLLTPSEYVAALNSGSFPDMVVPATGNQYEWVDAVSSTAPGTGTNTAPDGPGTSAGRLTAGYMGPDNGNNTPTAGDIFFATNAAYDATFSFIGYRCAR